MSVRNQLYILLFLCAVLPGCSPDSRQSGEYKIALVPELAGQHGIFVMNSDTSRSKLLTPEATAQLRPSSWSPDGKKIAFFAALRQDADILNQYRMPSHFLLYLINAAGGSPERLLDFPVSSFEFSPDGSQLLYVSAYEDPARNDADVVRGKKAPMSAVYLLNLQTGKHRRVTGFGQYCDGAWAPGGDRLALSFGTEKGSDIYTATLDGKHTKRISDSPGINTQPVWSPDGKKIAYISIVPHPEKGTDAGAYVMDAEGGNKRRIGNVTAYEVSWSLDGRSLLLQSAEGVTLASADGARTISLAQRLVQPRDAVFTPDGREIMFRSNHEGVWHLYAVDLAGAHLRRITGNLSASMFCLSPLKR